MFAIIYRWLRHDSVLGVGGFGSVFKGWTDEQSLAVAKPGTVIVKYLHDFKQFLTLYTVRITMRNFLILGWQRMDPKMEKVMFLLELWVLMDMQPLNIWPQVT